MSMNEIGGVQQPQIKKKQQDTATSANNSNTNLDVFASDNVAARVNLVADENNSLFSTNLKLSEDNATTETPTNETAKSDDLPEDIKLKYPSAEDQKALKSLSAEQLEQAKKLMDTKIKAGNIVQIVQLFKPEQVDKIKEKAKEMETAAGGADKVFVMGLTNDKYDKSSYNLVALNLDLSMQTTVLDKDLKTRSIERLSEHTTEDGKKYRIQEAYDIQNNTLSKIRYDFDEKYNTFKANYEIRSKIREDGSMVSREYTRPSQVAGIYDVEILDENGLRNPSKTKVKKNGRTTVRRDMESPDGTKTKYTYRDDPQGNRYSRYKITTKDGEVLMNNTKTFKVIDANTFKSTFNDNSYTMTIDGDILTVVDDNNPENTAKIDMSKIKGKKEAFIPVLKQMSGDQLIALSKTTDNLVGIDSVIKSYYDPKNHSINSGDDMFVVLHEEGHAKDFQTLSMWDSSSIQTLISRNKDLKTIFESETKAFNQAFPDAQREHVDYFINTLSHYGGPSGGIQETVAESNAILETPRSNELLGLRSQYLQQYFPRTIAKLNELLSENRERGANYPKIKLPPINIPPIQIPNS